MFVLYLRLYCTYVDLSCVFQHSCFPNAFVQNVFVDTHDLRFPWIAFFAGQYVYNICGTNMP